jgi:hypothetical protein
MNKVVLTNCTVEFTMPSAGEMGIDTYESNGTLKVTAGEYTHDLVLTCPHGQFAGKKIIFKKALLKIRAKLMPILDGDKVVLFTIEDELKPDAVVSNG